jgi:hypothetical protein
MEMMKTLTILAVFLVTANAALGQGRDTKLSLDSSQSLVQVEFVRHDRSAQETIRIKDGSEWAPALSAAGSPTRVMVGDPASLQTCTFQSSTERRTRRHPRHRPFHSQTRRFDSLR